MKIKILGFEIPVIYTNDRIRSGIAAQLHTKEGEIIVNDEICQSHKENAIIHEIFEFIVSYYELNQTSHLEISVFTNAWHQILKDNPDLIRMFYPRVYWNSTQVIGNAREVFDIIVQKRKTIYGGEWDWSSFYNGWLEGRFAMMAELNKTGEDH